MQNPEDPAPIESHMLVEDDDPPCIDASMLEPPPAAVPCDSRREFEAGLRYFAPLTLGVMLLLVIVFAWQWFSGALDSEEALIAAGALHRGRVLAGELHRLLTAALLHAGFGHLVGNLMMLYVLGVACEHAFGRWLFLSLFGLCAVGGSLLSILIQPGPSVGASGAIFGLAGAVIGYLWRAREQYVLSDKRVAVVLACWAGYQVVTGLFTPVIDNGAHVGGLLTGALLGALFSPVQRPTTR